MTISIYIHIPFCISKCNYCTFNSYPFKNFSDDFVFKYFEAVKKEINHFKHDFSVKTIYFGGGTPSIVKEKFIFEILNEIYKNFKIEKNCEITIEVNPDSFSEKKAKLYKSFGINRISIGIQSFYDKLLNFLGRIHNSDQGIKSIENAYKFFENVSVDLIFGIPNQDEREIINDLENVINLNCKHLSYYCLSIEKGSKFFGKVKEIDDERFNKFYDLIIDFLEENQFFQYEISNFSKKGYRCKHNLTYWDYREYLGFGAGAVSFYQDKRWQNIKSPEEYVKNFNKKEYEEILDEKTEEFEYIFMNLRKVEGLNLRNFEYKFNKNFFDEYGNILEKFKKYFIVDANFIRLNKEGFKISNSILSEFLN